ncbi:MAG TPA: substrate-binding domain-containing protein [Candidatus Copromonas avistercoris]|nr:substrate-binding domain-containing protein [Candidatus Copromonas avistercoris]
MRGFRYAADRLRAVFAAAVLMAFAAFALTACSFGTEEQEEASGSGDVSVLGSGDQTLRIVSGSENKELEPILEEYADEEDIRIEMSYKGSLDIMRLLEEEDISYDAVWPASSLWLTVGDTDHRVKHAESISITPVVFGIRKSLAEELGFVGREVSVRDILSAIEAGKLKFCMTSATQSNSGASAYIGFLYALLGNPEMITMEDLQSEELKIQVQELLYGVDRSSGSSDWLKDMFLEGDFDAMVNYECLMIQTNEVLEDRGEEPLYVVYPYDGLSLADSPLGYVDQGEEEKEELFLGLQEYLLSEETQDAIQRTGRRTGYTGISERNREIFREEWGLQPDRVLSPIRMPETEVLFECLNLYQTELRKPSLSVYCLDYSGSMSGRGNRQLVEAMEQLLIQENAAKNFLQASQDEVNILIPFNSEPIDVFMAAGNGSELEGLYERVEEQTPGGGTNMYSAIVEGLDLLYSFDLSDYTPAIILLTDGQSGGSIDDIEPYYSDLGVSIPIFSIMFGDADESQLEELAEYSNARVFDGRENLTEAFRSVKGYN